MPFASLSSEQKAEAEVLFHGDGTCTVENMETACFASERCNRCATTNTGSWTLGMGGGHLLVGLRGETVVAFAQWTPMCDMDFACCPTPGIYVSNLCVRAGNREAGYGRRMLAHMAATTPDPVYVAVALPHPRACEETRTVMEHRSRRLARFYQKLGFAVVEEGRGMLLLGQGHA